MVKTLSFPEALQTLQLPHLHRNLFSSVEWLEVIHKTYDIKLFIKYIERDQQVSSCIAYSVVNNFLEKKICLCSFCDYCDGYISQKEDWQLFFEDLRWEYPEYRIAVRNLRDQFVRENPNFTFLSKERFHILDVRDDLTMVWKRTHDSFKSAVQQAQKYKLTVKVCEKKDLRKFYGLHLKLRKNKYRLFPQPYKFFEHVWENFMDRDKGFLLGAFSPTGDFIAGTIYLVCDSTLYYKFNTSDVSALKFRPNNLLFWEGIKIAKERKLECIDMGSSGYEQTGLILFKDHTGARSQDITHLGFTPPNYKFSRKIILKIFTSVCTASWMPNVVTRLGSHIIYPYLA